MSRTDPNKGWTEVSYPGESQCVLVVLLIIGIVDQYPMGELFPIDPEGLPMIITLN